MEMKKRQTGIELLRIAAMIMIVMMHYLSHSGNLLEPGVPARSSAILGTILENFCIGAVNAYVFISGYYGSRAPYKPSKTIRFFFRIWFYALTIPLVLALLGQDVGWQNGIYGILYDLFPIETEHYWFATSFLLLMLFSPVVCAAVKLLSRRQMQITLIGAFLLLSVIKSICPVAFGFDQYGYDLPWFLFVYFLAAYAGKYDSQGIFSTLKKSRTKAGLLFLLSAGVGIAIQFSMFELGQLFGQMKETFAYYFTVPYHYNTVHVLTGSVGLFYWFLSFTVKEGKCADWIRKISGWSFGVYLLHEHMNIRDQWYGWLKNLLHHNRSDGIVTFVTELVCCVMILFLLGIFVDAVRSKIFDVIGKCLAKTKVRNVTERWDAAFQIEKKADKLGEQNGNE